MNKPQDSKAVQTEIEVDPLDVTVEEQQQIEQAKADFWEIGPDREGKVPVISEEPGDGEQLVAFWNETFAVKSGKIGTNKDGYKQAIIEVMVVGANSKNLRRTDTLWFTFNHDDQQRLTKVKTRMTQLFDACGVAMVKNPASGLPSIELTVTKALAGKSFQGLLAQGYQDRWDSATGMAIKGELEPFRRVVKYSKVPVKK